MSRGHGHVERTLIEAFAADQNFAKRELAARVWSVAPEAATAAQLASLGRALARLKRQGKVHASFHRDWRERGDGTLNRVDLYAGAQHKRPPRPRQDAR